MKYEKEYKKALELMDNFQLFEVYCQINKKTLWFGKIILKEKAINEQKRTMIINEMHKRGLFIGPVSMSKGVQMDEITLRSVLDIKKANELMGAI